MSHIVTYSDVCWVSVWYTSDVGGGGVLTDASGWLESRTAAKPCCRHASIKLRGLVVVSVAGGHAGVDLWWTPH